MTDRKFARESLTTMTEMTFPNHTNGLNNLMGGWLMYWMDIVSAIAAQRHSGNIVVTASVDNISFAEPISLGDVVTLKAQVTRAFHTSMEIHIEAWAENVLNKRKMSTNKAFFTFVALDKDGKPTRVPELEPETDEEKALYASALRRRQLRLVLAGRMKPDDASELKAIFDMD